MKSIRRPFMAVRSGLAISLLIFSLSAYAQPASSFNFSAASQTVSGWINVAGDPVVAVRTATDPVTGIHISSVATANWSPFNASGSCAFDGGGEPGGTFFPSAVILNHWFQYGNAAFYNPALAQLEITGLNIDSLYTLRMTGSFSENIPTFTLNPTQYTVAGATVYGIIDVNENFNVSDGAVFHNIAPDASGMVKIYVNTVPATNVASICGVQIIRGRTAGQVPEGLSGATIGDGLGQTSSGAIALGDTIPGFGPYSFTANRYEYLNGHMYSIGGTVNDPVTSPNFRIYNNGDLSAGTTMDLSVNTQSQTGMRYYNKLGVMQLGASDRLDTTQGKIVYGNSGGQWPGSGLLINSDDSNNIKGKLMNTVWCGDINAMDSLTYFENCLIATEAAHFFSGIGHLNDMAIVGRGFQVSAPMDNSFLSGSGNIISKPISVDNINGFQNVSQDTSRGSMITGADNQFGGLSQLVAGQFLINKTPYGTTLGNSNVDFSTQSYTGTQGTSGTAIIAQYPLFAIGNSANDEGAGRSNAITILYNGRTQINTTGYTNNLTQTNVTPKAALEVVSTNTGVLLPKLTTAQRNAIAAGDLQNGLLLYNTDSSVFQFYNGVGWTSVGSSSGSGANATTWGAAGNAGTSAAVNFIGTTDSQRLVFKTNNVETMTILPDGAVGIGTGTTFPATDAKLAVDGNIYAKKMKVTPNGWPDYVFDKKYTLPTLPELEKYIEQHKHLPGVATEVDVKKEGQDLGDNQTVLLKKVEELTLYVIELNNKVEKLAKENEVLKKIKGR